MAVMVGLWQKFTIQVNFVLIPSEAGIKTHWPELLLLNFFCHRPTIAAISWPPLGFHNFFTLAILCRTARLGHTLVYSLNGCFCVDNVSWPVFS